MKKGGVVFAPLASETWLDGRSRGLSAQPLKGSEE